MLRKKSQAHMHACEVQEQVHLISNEEVRRVGGAMTIDWQGVKGTSGVVEMFCTLNWVVTLIST
jgi:hypothetical protein